MGKTYKDERRRRRPIIVNRAYERQEAVDEIEEGLEEYAVWEIATVMSNRERQRTWEMRTTIAQDGKEI